MMEGVGVMRSDMTMNYWMRMVERMMKVIMDGGCSLGGGDTIRTEREDWVGEGVCMKSLICEERVDPDLRLG